MVRLIGREIIFAELVGEAQLLAGYNILGACGDYSCAAPHIFISTAFHTIVLALRAAMRTDTGQTRDTTQPAVFAVPS